MGGFTNLIYFKNYLSEQSKSQIKETIESCGEFELENDLEYDISVENNGEDYHFRIYYSDAEQDVEFDSESKAEFEKKLGLFQNVISDLWLGPTKNSDINLLRK
ncbi:hypothetical protein BST86_05865 [Nonlabens agnitus]|uniref:Uncharacterized protein n=1 Tax=Nonlabens agnitus TaxID=870484 RepID=A0A2S9WT56_9FLAO|nr:hypothetical protein BST86_05865 [Nonlabens agnitus]